MSPDSPIQLPDKLRCLEEPKRYKVLYGGRGGAKSWGVARSLLIQGAAGPLRILCAREIQKSIDDSVHRLLQDQVSALGLDEFYEVQRQAIIGKNGTQFLFAGLRDQNVTSIKSYEGIDRCWVEEAQTVSAKSWSILIPTIRKEGSEIWVTFNPEMDTDETYRRFVVQPPPGAVVVKIDYRDNPWFPATLEAERQHLLKVDPEAYENVWEGKPKTVVEGAIYRNEILKLVEERRLRPVPHDPLLKVHTVWDLGWNDQTSIICVQRVGGEARIVDYIEDSHKTLAEYVSELNLRKWNWGTDWLPHDGNAKTVQSGLSAKDILTKLGRNVQIVPNVTVETGIKAARLIFGRCYFDENKTNRLVDCLKRYRRAVNSHTNEPGAPLHDEHSHGADAFRYMALIVDKTSNDDKMKPLTYDNRGIW